MGKDIKFRLDAYDRIQKRIKHIDSLRDWFIGGAGSGALYQFVTFLTNGNEPFHNTPFEYAQIVVKAGIIVLIVLWFTTGTNELSYIQNWLRAEEDYDLKSDLSVIAVFFLIAFFPNFLDYKTDSVHLFFLIYAAYLLVDIFSWIVRRTEIAEGINAAEQAIKVEEGRLSRSQIHYENEKKLFETHRQMLECLKKYYIGRPHLLRLCFFLAFVAVLGMCAYYFSAYYHQGKTQLGTVALNYDYLRTAAYLAFGIGFVVSEMTLNNWRKVMKHKEKMLRTEKTYLIKAIKDDEDKEAVRLREAID